MVHRRYFTIVVEDLFSSSEVIDMIMIERFFYSRSAKGFHMANIFRLGYFPSYIRLDNTWWREGARLYNHSF